MTLPPPRHADAAYSIAMVCLGNICRSPTAQVVLTRKLAAAGLAGRVVVTSAGTGDWHVGDGMDRRAAATLAAHGYDPSAHRAQHFTASWLPRHDLVVAMDQANLRDIRALATSDDDQLNSRVVLLRSFDPAAGDELDVPDPWYGGQQGFDDVLAMVERATDVLVEQLTELLVDS